MRLVLRSTIFVFSVTSLDAVAPGAVSLVLLRESGTDHGQGWMVPV